MTEHAQKPRLLVISPGGLGPHYHGPAIALFRLLLGQRDRLSVDVVHGTAEQEGLQPLEGRAIRTGTKHDNLLRSSGYIVGAALYVLRNRKQYDAVLLASLSLLTLIPGAIAHLCGLRVVARAAAMAEVSTETGGALGRWLKRRMMQMVPTYIAISQGIAKALKGAVGERTRVHPLPNSVNTDRFHPVDSTRAASISASFGFDDSVSANDRVRLVCVGALGQRKGQHLIVEALAMLPENVSLLLVGPEREAGYLDHIRAVAERASLTTRVRHVSFLPDVELAYQAGAIFVLPSVGEGMPNGMLEAMSCGLVPIGTRISGIEDLVRDDCGCFIARDAESIAQAVRSYVDNPEMLRKQRLRARALIEAEFQAETVGNEVFDLLFDQSRSAAQ